MSRYEGVLRAKAKQLAQALASEGVHAQIIEDSFREYHVKLQLMQGTTDYGPLVLYYKPSKQAFTPRVHELKDTRIVPQIEAAWARLQGTQDATMREQSAALEGIAPKLRERAAVLLPRLQAAGYTAQLLEDSFKGYGVSLAVQRDDTPLGKLRLFYAPTHGTYTLKSDKLKDQQAAQQIADLWDAWLRAEAKQVTLAAAQTAHQAYVDGSFIGGKIGYGAVILHQGDEIQRLWGPVDAKFAQSRQIAGELAATMRAVRWCVQQGLGELDVFFDYKGVQQYAQKTHINPDNRMALQYAAYMRKAPLHIHWHHVRSHTGNYWNDVADALAKQGASE